MPTVVEELVIGLGYKTDTKSLDKASKAAEKSAEKAEKAFKDTGKEIEKVSDQIFETQDKNTKRALKAQLRALKKRQKAQKDTARVARETAKKAQGAAGRVARSNREAAQKVRGQWKRAGKFVGLSFAAMAVASVAALAKIGMNVIENVREMDKWTAKLGASAQEVQKLDIVAKDLNIDIDNSREAIKTLRENLGELDRIGTGPALDSLGSLGIKLEEIKDLGVEDQLALLSTALAEVEDPAKQLSIAIELMGEDGAALLPLLKKDSAEIRRLGQEAEKSGRILSDEMIANTKEVDRTLVKMKGSLEAGATAIAAELAPAAKDISKDIDGWIDQNQELIKQDIPEVVKGIAEAMRLVVNLGSSFVGVFADAKRGLEDLADGVVDFGDKLGFGVLVRLGLVSEEAAAASQRRVKTRGVSTGGFSEETFSSELREGENLFSTAVDAENTEAAQAAQRAKRRGTFERKEKNKGGKTKDQREAEKAAAIALARVAETGLEDDIRRLAGGVGLGETAIKQAIKAAQGQFQRGAVESVAREAGVSVLSGLSGVDLAAQQKDPLLSALFGDGGQPDVPLSKIAQNKQPQVLISNITNNFNVDVNNRIDGSGDPVSVAENVADKFREMFDNEVAQASKFAKVNFAR